jgi:surfeit locus 1 family protein
MQQSPSWFAVARRPKWIGGLFLAMAIAVICALFAQWQAGRSVEAPLKDAEANAVTLAKAPMLDTVIKPGRTPRPSAVGTLVRTSATLNTGHFWVVANRQQENGTRGFWVVGSYSDQAGNKFIAPLGFTTNRSNALAVAKRLTGSMVDQSLAPMHGRLSPGEGPQPIRPVLQSLSLGQLANQLPTDAGQRVYPLFLLVTESAATGLERITVTSLNQAQINWLSAFYALEWTAFCGFSFFMWWRLVRDQQQRERGEL